VAWRVAATVAIAAASVVWWAGTAIANGTFSSPLSAIAGETITVSTTNPCLDLKVPDDVGEVLELLTGKKPGTYELDVHTSVPGKAGELAAQALELRAQADALAGTVATTTSTAVVTLSKSGFSMRDIGQLVGVSHQRVDQIVKADEAARFQRSGKRTSLKVS
jgi:hypothetical protein